MKATVIYCNLRQNFMLYLRSLKTIWCHVATIMKVISSCAINSLFMPSSSRGWE